ncbi:MAG TPA: chemotaxis protein CheB [Gemmatirosa sp.]|nr:chemotaxis protein CheB [Gemmatirosa sp.]
MLIGASWGGLHAVSTILAMLPPSVAAPIVVVQHRARVGDGLLAELLQACTGRRVGDVEDKEPILPHTVYVAPSDYHLLVEDGHFSLTTDPVVRYSRPSIDVTLTSAAEAVGPRALGVVLTGANDDGARGLRRLVERGGEAIVQEPTTAEVRTMPEAAIQALHGAPAAQWEVAPLERVAACIAARLTRSATRAAGSAA